MRTKTFLLPAFVVVATAATAGASVPLFRPSASTPTVPIAPTVRPSAAAAPLPSNLKASLLAQVIAQTHATPMLPQPNLPSPFNVGPATLGGTNPAILDFELNHPYSVWAANGTAGSVSFTGCGPNGCLEPQVAVAWASPPNAVYMVDCTVSDQSSGATFLEIDWAGGRIPGVPYATPTHIVFAATATPSSPARWGSGLQFSAIAGFRLTADKDWSFSGCEVTLAGAIGG